MDILSQLPQTTEKQQRRVGRGYGSQKGGHTTGRGAKGDKVRGKTRITFDGTKIKKGWIKRTPFLRGKHRVLAAPIFYTYSLSQMDKWFESGATIDIKSIALKSGIDEKVLLNSVKILASGVTSKTFNFKGVLFSKSAQEKILSLGGKIE